ncbi:hypothetical protein [Glycomyces paridis]|uniref:Uncharacterized protein n=1 Tax=Glycomyces paridis TaxID=2126555 RepID=A0A4S8P735_9ACTN|nr:hypothetical protein [Glycomyces paridis]THV23549.1 hypothetical protein E9998_22385 [Glycomyces paridis]
MPPLPWLIEGPRSQRLFIVCPDAPVAQRAALAARLDDALAGFAEAPAGWFLSVERLGHWRLVIWMAVAMVAMPFATGNVVNGVAAGAILGLIAGGVFTGLSTYAAKAQARRRAGRDAEATIEALKPSVRPIPGGLEWGEAVIADDPSAEYEVHGLLWRMTFYGTPEGEEAANAMFQRWKQVDPKAAAEMEAEEAAEEAELRRLERGDS